MKKPPCLPDARGRFIRVLDNREDENQRLDPKDNRKLGDTQEDTFKKHSHTYIGHSGMGASDMGGNAQLASPKDLTTETGHKETRPKNMVLNLFIKINDD